MSVTDEDGWTRIAYEDSDADAMMTAWLQARTGEPIWRSEDGREVWVDYRGTEAFRASVEDGQAVMRVRYWRDTTPAEMPTDPFCPGEQLRPSFRVGDEGRPTLRTCREVGSTRKAGPWALAQADTVAEGTMVGGRLHGPFTVSQTTETGTQVLTTGEYDSGTPVGEWRFSDQTVAWRDGHPVPSVLDGVLSMPSDVRGQSVDSSEFTVLDISLATGHVAWRVRHKLNFARMDSGARNCGYPGLEPGEGVVLGLESLHTGDVQTWTVYESVNGDTPCTTEAEAVASLDAAKGAFAEHGLDVTRTPEPMRITDDSVDLGDAHTLSVSAAPRSPSVYDVYRNPWLVGQAPYVIEDLMGDHQVFHAIEVDGRTVFRSFRYQSSGCAGQETLTWDGAWRQGERAVATFALSRHDCHGLTQWRGFSPIFEL